MKGRSARRRRGIPATVAFVTFMAPLAASAQDSTVLTTSTPYATPAEMLTRLESGEHNISMIITAAFAKDRQVDDHSMYLGNYNRYTDAERRAILDGVERIARGVGNEPFAERAEMEAFSVLSTLGRDPALRGPHEIPDRLLRVYEEAKKDDVKLVAVQQLGRILRERPAAAPRIVDLLISLIHQPVTYRRTLVHGNVPVIEGPVHPDDALDALLSACEAGVPALRRLQANPAAIQHNSVRARVDSAARAGFAPGRMRLSSTGMNPCPPDQPTR